jgi:1-acyl-sn-glycerol-3-phosphate acyltransferase
MKYLWPMKSLPAKLRYAVATLLGILTLTGFAITLILVVPLYFLVFSFANQENAPHLAHQYISRNWARLLFPVFFIRLKILHADQIDPHRTYVFVANHRSLLDIPAFARSCKNTFRFLAKKELTRIPGLGWIIRKLYLSVDRSDQQERARSMALMKASLENGISVFICPEGTRNTTSAPLLPMKDGAFRLAIEAQVPVAILTVLNSDQRLSPLHPLALFPGPMTCVWSPPIETKGMTLSDVSLLKNRAAEIMTAQLKENRNAG